MFSPSPRHSSSTSYCQWLSLLVTLSLWISSIALPVYPVSGRSSGAPTHGSATSNPGNHHQPGVGATGSTAAAKASTPLNPATEQQVRAQAVAGYGRLPLAFEENVGQSDAQVKFLSHTQGMSLFLTSAEAVLAFGKAAERTKKGHTTRSEERIMRMRLVGAKAEPEVEGINPLPGRVNYLIGNNEAEWRTDVPTYAKVRYRGVYPGVDMIYYGNRQQLEYDLIVAPGTDPNIIKLGFEETGKLRIDKRGDLILSDRGGEFRLQKPEVYQEKEGQRKTIKCRYVVEGKGQVRFAVADYDRSLPLVIDPALVYSTFLGPVFSTAITSPGGIAVDSQGSAIIVGQTGAINFPTKNPLQGSKAGNTDAFITKLSPDGSSLAYSTYLGGTNQDYATEVAVDSQGNAYITGSTNSTDFPVMNAYQPQYGGGSSDVFVAKLNPTGSALLFSTYLGGADSDGNPNGTSLDEQIAVDSQGNAYVSSYTASANFPVTPGAFQTTKPNGSTAPFVSKFNSTGALIYSTFVGGKSGSSEPLINAIAVDSSGSAYLTGFAQGGDFPVTPGAFQTTVNKSYKAAFVAKLDATGATLDYATFLAGSGNESSGQAIAVDSSGDAYVAGATNSVDFPLKSPNQPKYGGGASDAFVTKINPTGSALIFSTFLGGSDIDGDANQGQMGIAVDPAGNSYVTGFTYSIDFPTLLPIQAKKGGTQTSNGSTTDVFLTEYSAGGIVLFSTYLGGNGSDNPTGIALDSADNVYLSGYAGDHSFPTTPGAFQTQLNGGIFVAKISTPTSTSNLSVLDIEPNAGGNTGPVSTLIRGTGFVSGATVKLVEAGQPDIAGSFVNLGASSLLEAVFDLTGATPGMYDVVVTNPDGSSSTLTGGFTVQNGGSPDLSLDIVGRDTVRGGREQYYYLIYSNTGTVDAYGVPVFLSFPSFLTWKPGFTVLTPPPLSGFPPVDFSQVPKDVQVGAETRVPLFVPVMRAGRSGSLAIKFTVPDQLQYAHIHFAINARLGPPMFQSVRITTDKAQKEGRTASFTGRINPLGFTANNPSACAVDITNILFNAVFAVVPVAKAEACGFAFFQNVFAQPALDVIAASVGGALGNQPPNFAESSAAFSQDLIANSLYALLTCATKSTPGVGTVISIFQALAAAEDALKDCAPPDPKGTASKSVESVVSHDPNEKDGAEGVGSSHFINGNKQLPYAIFFENQDTATAPAQTVTITDQLDPSKVDLSTFEFGSISFGSNVVTPTPLSTQFNTDIDLRPTTNLIVRISAKLDQNTGLVTWQFTSLDPATGQLTTDPNAGFLPPDKNPPEGEGSVQFTVQPKQGLATNTQITNMAQVVFDLNPPIDTPVWTNTIDNTAPISKVQSLASQQQSRDFQVSWSGTDVGSGIRDYTIYVSQNGGAFMPWLVNTTATSATFVGQPNTTYSFYSIARDLVGNQEAAKTAAEATTMTSTSNAPTVQFSVDNYAVNKSDGSATITVTRTGDTTNGASISYATSNGTASDRKDYETALGTLTFGPGETTKTFTILIVNNGYMEGDTTVNLTLSNPSAGLSLGMPSTATLTIHDDSLTAAFSNPIDNPAQFVTQHYADFLNRAPDVAGLTFWINQIVSCSGDPTCIDIKRQNVSAAYFLSREFQETGFFAIKVQRAAFGKVSNDATKRISYQQFIQDAQAIGNGFIDGQTGADAVLDQNKTAYVQSVVSSTDFIAKYPTTLSASAFVDALFTTAGVTPQGTERQDAITAFGAGDTAGRAAALRKVAESESVKAAEFNSAFVLLQYFGYLRRNPTDPPDTSDAGYQFWLNKLTQANGNYISSQMVRSFIVSQEYRQRFGTQ